MIFITGDVHGDKSRFQRMKNVHLKKTDTLIVCGDFGFIWDGSKKEQAILKQIGKKKYRILFVDGCNENHQLLSEYDLTDCCGGQARRISGNLYCLQRGEIYTIEDKKIFAFGGGDALDEYSQKTNDAEVLPSVEEMQFASTNLSSGISLRVT